MNVELYVGSPRLAETARKALEGSGLDWTLCVMVQRSDGRALDRGEVLRSALLGRVRTVEWPRATPSPLAGRMTEELRFVSAVGKRGGEAPAPILDIEGQHRSMRPPMPATPFSAGLPYRISTFPMHPITRRGRKESWILGAEEREIQCYPVEGGSFDQDVHRGNPVGWCVRRGRAAWGSTPAIALPLWGLKSYEASGLVLGWARDAIALGVPTLRFWEAKHAFGARANRWAARLLLDELPRVLEKKEENP